MELYAYSTEEPSVILNMVSDEEKKYIKFNEYGSVNLKLINSYSGGGINFQKIKFLSNINKVVELCISDEIDYINSDGDYASYHMDLDDKYGDPNEYVYSLSTGESGFTGYFLTPYDSFSRSLENSYKAIIHPSLSEQGKAESGSHELLGHVCLAVMGYPYLHERVNEVDTNILLKLFILSSMKETQSYFKD